MVPATAALVVVRTNAPVADAMVQLRQANRDDTVRLDAVERIAQTDASGVVRFLDVPEGRYLVTVSTIGYIFVHRTVQVGVAPLSI